MQGTWIGWLHVNRTWGWPGSVWETFLLPLRLCKRQKGTQFFSNRPSTNALQACSCIKAPARISTNL